MSTDSVVGYKRWSRTRPVIFVLQCDIQPTNVFKGAKVFLEENIWKVQQQSWVQIHEKKIPTAQKQSLWVKDSIEWWLKEQQDERRGPLPPLHFYIYVKS